MPRAASGDELLAGFDDVRPSQPEAGGVRGRRAAGQRGSFPAGQDLGADEAEHGGQEGQGGGHGEGHRDGRGDRQAVEEGDAEGELAEQGDAHRDPGEQDGAAGGVHRLGDGVFVGQPGFDARCDVG